jgi:bacteriocin-like protein
MEKIKNEVVGEQVRAVELTENELAHISGGYDDGAPWCGTHPPGWHPPILGPHKVS